MIFDCFFLYVSGCFVVKMQIRWRFYEFIVDCFFFWFFFPSMCRMQVLEAIGRSPFLVGMHYAFQTESKLYLILGMFNVHP